MADCLPEATHHISFFLTFSFLPCITLTRKPGIVSHLAFLFLLYFGIWKGKSSILRINGLCCFFKIIEIQFLSAVFSLIVGLKNFPVLHLQRDDFHDLKSTISLHLKTGFPMGFQMSVMCIGQVCKMEKHLLLPV